MMPEPFAPEDIRKMDLDNRQIGGVQRIENRDRGMSQRAGVENDPVGRLARLLNPVDELAFVVGLAEVDCQIERPSPRQAALLDIGQRIVPVGRWLAHPEQVQVRAVKNEDSRQSTNSDAASGLIAWNVARQAAGIW